MANDASLDATMETAIAAQRAGRLDEAARLYRAVLQRQADHAVANHNLGVLTAQGGEPRRSLPLFAAALRAQPGEPLYWLSYARGLVYAGHADEALETLGRARRQGFTGPGFEALTAQSITLLQKAADAARTPQGLDRLGAALTAQGALDDAIQAFRAALDLDPDFADAHFHLGSVLSENGQVARGFEHYMRRASLVHGARAAGGRAASNEGRDEVSRAPPAHQSKHDLEQRDYLASLAIPGAAAVFRIGEGARLDGPAVNPANATPALFDHWRDHSPQMTVIDDFLTAAALERLQRYCAESTIWRRPYAAGYLGATPEDGFACPLLAQIVEEIQSTYAQILECHPFRYLGAFKYDSELSTGTNTHADNSAVNVNFYLAPDDANLDSASGGMRIWDVAAPDDATMRRCNGDEGAAREFLERSDARTTIVPHRANRAVIFKSALFHKTDDCHFRAGYLNRRINVSLLFGRLGDPT